MSSPADPAALARELAVCREHRRVAEEAQRQLSLFLDSVQDYAFITFDLAGRVVGWSRGAERVLGYAEQDAIGLPGSVFFTPEDVVRGEDVKEFAVAREVGRAEDERWHLRRDGARFWGSGVMTAMIDPLGRLCGYSKVMRDHTARRLAEARLRESEERLRLFCENVRDYALIPIDLSGLVVGWNPGAASIFGYTADEIHERPGASLFTPEDIARGEPEQDRRRALAEGRSEHERELVRKDGTRFWAHWVTTPIRDEQDQLRGFARVLHDITDRKQADERREGQHASEQSLLRTQVQSTGEALDRTKEELRALAGSLLTAQEDERRRISRELHDDLSQRLAVLANSLVRLQRTLPAEPANLRVEAGRIEQDLALLASDVRQLSHRLHPAILDDLGLGPAIRRLVEEFEVSRAERASFLAHAVPDQIPRDAAAAFYRIAQEALRNITKHADSGPVHVELDGEGDELRLIVRDHGPGFDPAGARGRGLGIISMQERAHLVGGTLRLTTRPGDGTTIDVRAPLTASTP